MSERLKAWYLLLALGFVTLLLLSFGGRPPAALSSVVALPHRLVYTASVNLREFVASGRDRRNLRAVVSRLEDELASARAQLRQLELQNARYADIIDLRAAQSPGVMMSAPVVSVPVVSAGASAVGGTLELGISRAAGIVPDMPVTVADGLVGLVTKVSSKTAWVRTLVDPASSVGVMVRGRGGQGIGVGEAGGVFARDGLRRRGTGQGRRRGGNEQPGRAVSARRHGRASSGGDAERPERAPA